MVQVFNVDGERLSHRLDAWQEIVSNTFVDLDCRPPRARELTGKIATAGTGPIALSLVDTVGQTVDRTHHLIRKDDAEVVLISCQIDGGCSISQDGRQVQLWPGEFAIYDSTRPYKLHFEDSFRQLVLHMPREHFRRRLGRLRGLSARQFRSDSSAYSIASIYLQELAKRLIDLDRLPLESYSQVAIDLVSLAIEKELGEPGPVLSRPADGIREQANQIIRRRFRDERLSTPDIAGAIGISVRRLQEVFAKAESTPMETIWRHRLDAASAMLRDPAFDQLSVTEIAYRCGFGDSAQFSRKFKANFGLRPREARRGSQI